MGRKHNGLLEEGTCPPTFDLQVPRPPKNCRVSLASFVLSLMPPFGLWGFPWVLSPELLLNQSPSPRLYCPRLGQPSQPLAHDSGGSHWPPCHHPPSSFIYFQHSSQRKFGKIPISPSLSQISHNTLSLRRKTKAFTVADKPVPCGGKASVFPLAHSIPDTVASLLFLGCLAEILPQDLCTCCSHCLALSSPRLSLGSFLPLHQGSAEMSPLQ